jgi:HPt (histidine-containing phosphotransfer) domain-containing protein
MTAQSLAVDNEADPCRVAVEKDIADLIPRYMRNRRKDLTALREGFVTDNFDQLRRLGHRLQGCGGSFGFWEITALGEEIAKSAVAEDRSRIAALIDSYREYLARVEVVYE